MSQRSFFAELQRRHVYKVGAAYCVAGWLLVQIVTQVFPIFHVADRTQQWLVLAVIAGFPVALILAWLFDITPQGIVRTAAQSPDATVVPEQSQPHNSGRRVNLVLAVLLVLAAGDAGWEHFRRGVIAIPSRDGRSIAVLPLVNESGDTTNDYFADGLSEELISALAQIGDLRIIGRSSSFRFRNSSDSSSVIGQKLGVTRLLEGTVRRQGDRVRIVAELINVADGSEIWSRTYDRDLKDLFAVQSEIAMAVADSLKLTLLGKGSGEPPMAGTTLNSAAHDAYLRAHYFLERRNLEEYRLAVQYYDKAIALDPSYALAYAERSECWTWIADFSTTDDPLVSRTKAREDAEKAVSLAPDLAQAHSALGWVRFFVDWKFEEGLGELHRAASLAPNSAVVNEVLTRALLYIGKTREAEALAHRVIELDPLNFSAAYNLARVYISTHRFEEAAREGRRSVELQPTGISNHRWQVEAALFLNDAAGALKEARLEPGTGYREFEMALALSMGSDGAAADAALNDLIRLGKGFAYQIAEVYAYRGDSDKTFEWLDRAYAQRDTGLLGMTLDPLLDTQRGDPRYAALVAKVGLPPPE